MVVAVIALVVALGGSAWAVTKVGTKQIRNGAVTAPKLRNGAVTSAKLGPGSVTGPKVAAGAIAESDLLDGSVTGDKIAQTTIKAANLKNSSVPGRAIQDGAVLNDQVKAGSLAADRLSASAQLSLKGALAYGVVSRTTPSFISKATSGFSAVSRGSTGVYCLTPTPEVAALAFGSDGNPVRPLLANVEMTLTSSAATAPFVMPNGDSRGSCAARQYEVHTMNAGSYSSDISFIVAIP